MLSKCAICWHLVVILALCLIAFWNSLGGEFVWDDQLQVLRNVRIRDLSNLPSAFTSAVWSFAVAKPEGRMNYYRPLQIVMYTLAYRGGGLSPTTFHAINLTFHIATCFFFYFLACELLRARTAALAVAALFAVHPIHTEAVAWIAAFPDVSCGAFYFAAFWAFLKYRKTSRLGWGWFSAILFLAALFCKEMAITLPVAIFVLQSIKSEYRLNWRENTISLAILGMSLLIYIPARMYALRILAISHRIDWSWLDSVALTFRAFVEYLRYSIVPYPLKAIHIVPIHFADTVIETSTCVATVTIAVAMLWYKKDR